MTETIINGMPADLFQAARALARAEDHDKRHKWHPQPGTADEAIANMSRFFPSQTRLQPMSAESAHTVLAQIKENIASISIKALDGLSPSQAATLERLLQISEEAHEHIVDGITPKVTPLQLPAEDFGAKNQSDWEGQRLATRIRGDWREQPDTI